MIKIMDEIGKKIEVTIPLVIFLIVIINLFFNIFSPNEANRIYMSYSVLVAIYIFIYGFYHLTKNKIKEETCDLRLIDFLLICNFFIIGLLLLYLPNTSLIDNFPNVIKFIIWGAFTLFLVLSVAIPFIILVLFTLQFKYNKQQPLNKYQIRIKKR